MLSGIPFLVADSDFSANLQKNDMRGLLTLNIQKIFDKKIYYLSFDLNYVLIYFVIMF